MINEWESHVRIEGPDGTELSLVKRGGWFLIDDGSERVAVSPNDFYWLLKAHHDRSVAWTRQIAEEKLELERRHSRAGKGTGKRTYHYPRQKK